MGKVFKRDIPGYEGLYAADRNGNIYSLITDRSRRKGRLKPYTNTGGYLRVNLHKNGKCKHEYVHRLIALTFIENPECKRYVNHKDSNVSNNRVENLEWCTAKYNIAYSRLQGKQHKDRCVTAISILTGEKRVFPNMRAASTLLFGRHYALEYMRKVHGSQFDKGGWRITVND